MFRELHDVCMRVQCRGNYTPQISVTVQAGAEAGRFPIQLTLTAASAIDKMTSTLDAKNGWIPAQLLESVAPMIAGYGTEARFCGVVLLGRDPDCKRWRCTGDS